MILSAQCTDKRVNETTPTLFEAFPTPHALSLATNEEVYPYIRSISYPQSKARYLVETAQILVESFDGEIPDHLATLQTLPGVGRKTANVILATIYNKPAIPVDTHVMRVSRRLGLISKKATTPLAIEHELVARLPRELVSRAHHWLVLHGRYLCTARKPQCYRCPFTSFCPYYKQKKLSSSVLELPFF